jgi:predicted RNase H-like HicB family nuclease
LALELFIFEDIFFTYFKDFNNKEKHTMRNAELTILIQKDIESGWYVGQIEEFPAAISQGQTIAELKENLIDALKLLLETQKLQLSKENNGQKVLKRKLQFA